MPDPQRLVRGMWRCSAPPFPPVLRIRDVYPGSRIRLFSIPDPGSASKNLSILTQTNGFWALQKIWFRLFIQDPNPDFLPIPDPGSRGQKGTGSRIPDPQYCSPPPYHQAWQAERDDERHLAKIIQITGTVLLRTVLRIRIRRIRIFLGLLDPDPSIFYQRYYKKPWLPLFFGTFFWLFIFEKWCKCTFKKNV